MLTCPQMKLRVWMLLVPPLAAYRLGTNPQILSLKRFRCQFERFCDLGLVDRKMAAVTQLFGNRRLRKLKDHELPQFIAVIESCSTVANDTQIKYGI
jgi:hypothetical protein